MNTKYYMNSKIDVIGMWKMKLMHTHQWTSDICPHILQTYAYYSSSPPPSTAEYVHMYVFLKYPHRREVFLMLFLSANMTQTEANLLVLPYIIYGVCCFCEIQCLRCHILLSRSQSHHKPVCDKGMLSKSSKHWSVVALLGLFCLSGLMFVYMCVCMYVHCKCK